MQFLLDVFSFGFVLIGPAKSSPACVNGNPGVIRSHGSSAKMT